MPRLLWCSDAVIDSGFSRVAKNVLQHLAVKGWDVHVLGILYDGDPHDWGFPVYPAGEDLGLSRLPSLAKKLRPDVVLVLHDPWVVERFVDRVDAPMMAYVPVDAPNMRPQAAMALSRLARTIFYTKFGLAEAVKAGFVGRGHVIPHGCDTTIYAPIDRDEARHRLGWLDKLPSDTYIVGNANRNQPRKRLDLTISYFAHWVEQYRLPKSVRLYLHCAPFDVGWNIVQLADYFGVRDRLIVATDLHPMRGVPEEVLRLVYGAMDVQVSTTLGEGWGLTVAESMAVGRPQIVPEWAALAEWPSGAVRYVPVTSIAVTPQAINTIGGVADQEEFVRALHELYEAPDLRKKLGACGHELVNAPAYRWENVAEQFHEVLMEVAES